MKKYNYPIEWKSAKKKFVFFEKTCMVCNNLFKLEKMWVTKTKQDNKIKRIYICKECVNNEEEFLSLISDVFESMPKFFEYNLPSIINRKIEP